MAIFSTQPTEGGLNANKEFINEKDQGGGRDIKNYGEGKIASQEIPFDQEIVSTSDQKERVRFVEE